MDSATILHSDPHRVIRSLAAKHGFRDDEHAGELAQLFDGGRKLRYLRPSGVSLDRFGEMLADHGVTDCRLTPAEVADLLSATFDSRPIGKAQKPPSRAALSRAEERKMRSRLFECPECRQKIRGTRNSSAICGLCHAIDGKLVTFTPCRSVARGNRGDDRSDPVSGGIVRMIIATCGIGYEDFECGETTCNSDDDIGEVRRNQASGWTVAGMKRYLAANGWAFTTRFGWICPFCAKHISCTKETRH